MIDLDGTVVDLFNKDNINDTKEKDRKEQIQEIIKSLTKEHMNLLKKDDKESSDKLEKIIDREIRQRGLDKSSAVIIERIKSHIFGYGILEKYIRDPEVNNIFVNDPKDIWIQKGLERTQIDETFEDTQELLSYVKIIESNLSGVINRDNATATFYDMNRNLRIIAAIEPIAQNSPVLFIRTHQDVDNKLSLESLIEAGCVTEEQAEFLVKEIQEGKNVVFAGIGSSGKTTMMRALVNKLSNAKRVQVMEESPELQLSKKNVVAYLVRRNERGKAIGLGDLIEIGLKSSIDLFIFGETRGEEAMALYDAAFSGHQVLTTLHTSSSDEVPERLLINMKKSGTDIPSEILLSMVYKALDYLVQMKDFKIQEISRVSKDGIKPIDFKGGENIGNNDCNADVPSVANIS